MEKLLMNALPELKMELKIYAAKNNLYPTQVVLPLIADHIGRPDLVPVKWKPRNPRGEGAESAIGKWCTRKRKPRNPEGMERLRINIPSELKLELKVYAARNKLSLTEIVLTLIADHLGRPDLVPVKWKPRNPEGEEATHAEGE